MPLILLLLLVPIVVIALMPLMLIQRYRAGKARRLARPWVATLNLAVMAFSAVFFLLRRAVHDDLDSQGVHGRGDGTGGWCPARRARAGDHPVGTDTRALHYTPNRWLVLIVTLIVSARVLYGLFRSLAMAQAGFSGGALVTAFGVPESLAAGAIVIGYYLAYNAGLRWRIRRWQHRALRAM